MGCEECDKLRGNLLKLSNTYANLYLSYLRLVDEMEYHPSGPDSADDKPPKKARAAKTGRGVSRKRTTKATRRRGT